MAEGENVVQMVLVPVKELMLVAEFASNAALQAKVDYNTPLGRAIEKLLRIVEKRL